MFMVKLLIYKLLSKTIFNSSTLLPNVSNFITVVKLIFSQLFKISRTVATNKQEFFTYSELITSIPVEWVKDFQTK